MPSRYHLGIDLGGTNIKIALIDNSGHVVVRDTIKTDAFQGHDAVLQRMIVSGRDMMSQAPDGGDVVSIGVGVPGEVDMDAGTTVDLPNLLDRWLDVPVTPPISDALGAPAFLINDVRAFTVAESQLGAARGAATALCVAVGTGIGGGLVTHGDIHFGLGGAAGEIGHLIVLADGPRCGCGSRGCVEALASGPAITAEATRRILQGFTTRLTSLVKDDVSKLTPELIAEAAEGGDEVARDVMNRAGYFLGLALAGAIALVAPEVVVIGGGVGQPNSVYWQAFESTARANSHVTDIDRIEFRPAALGYDAGVIGAAWWGALALERQTATTGEGT
jgi:glucokinase